MDCPNCTRPLKPTPCRGSTVEICTPGCGGIWFDGHEVRRVDSASEPVEPELLEIEIDDRLKIDVTAKKKCPVCLGQTMMKHHYSAAKQVMVDECPSCGGIWLDAGELGVIRAQFRTDEERKAAAREILGRFDSDLEEMAQEDAQTRKRRMRHFGVLRHLCPSYHRGS